MSYRSSNFVDSVATPQDRVKREHPDHTSEVPAGNEFCKVRERRAGDSSHASDRNVVPLVLALTMGF